ncbi:membrane hypothetical protein [Vibrio chagasii]|nr:membrane hypothetical protein [Vibrio chagasii]
MRDCCSLISSLKLLLFVFVVSLASAVKANDFNVDDTSGFYSIDLPTYQDIEEVSDNIGNKLILSMFGVEGLVAFLGGSIDEGMRVEILELQPLRVRAMAAPFPHELHFVIMSIVHALYLLVTAYFSSLMIRYTLERVYFSMDENSESRASPFYMIAVRSFVGFFVVVPVIGKLVYLNFSEDNTSNAIYSGLHIMMFNSFGNAFRLADKISNDANEHIQPLAPLYTVPDASIFVGDMVDLVDHLMCLQTLRPRSDNVESIDLQVNRSLDGGASFTSNYGACRYEFKINPNGDFVEQIRSANLEAYVSEPDDIQGAANFKALNDVVSKAAEFTTMSAQKLVNVRDEQNINVSFDGENWREHCSLTGGELGGTVDSWVSYSTTKETLARCLSLGLVRYLSYPVEDVDFDEIVSTNSNHLNGRLKNVCLASNERSENPQASGVDSLRSCAVDRCKSVNVNSEKSGLFECSVAADSFSTGSHLDVIQRGGFLSGMVTHYSNMNVSTIPSGSKAPINNIQVRSSGVDLAHGFSRSSSDVNSRSNMVRSPVRPISDNYHSKEIHQMALVGGGKYSGSKARRFSVGWGVSVPEHRGNPAGMNINYIDGVELNIQERAAVNPFARAKICTLSPRELTSVGICGGIMQELTRLGRTTAGLYAGLVMGNKAVETWNKRVNITAAKDYQNKTTKTKDSEKNKVEGKESSTENNRKNPKSSKIPNVMKALGLTALGGIIGNKLLASVSNDNTSSDDHYGEALIYDMWNSTLGLGIGMLVTILNTEKTGEKSQPLKTKDSVIWSVALSSLKAGLFYVTFVTLFVIPIMPIIFLFTGVITAFAAMLSLMIAAPFIVIAILANADENDATERVKKAVSRFLVAFIRVPLLVMGFYLALHLIEVVTPSFLSLSYASMVTLEGAKHFTPALFIGFLFSMIICATIVYSCMDVVKQLYSISRMMILGEDTEESQDASMNTGRMIQNKLSSMH